MIVRKLTTRTEVDSQAQAFRFGCSVVHTLIRRLFRLLILCVM